MPGVTLVKIPKTQNAGYRNPSTIIAASSRWMLPWYSSSATGGNARTHRNRRPPSQRTVASSSADHSHRNDAPLEGPGGVEQARRDGRVGEGAESADGHDVRVGDVDGPVGEGVEPERAQRRRDDQRTGRRARAGRPARARAPTAGGGCAWTVLRSSRCDSTRPRGRFVRLAGAPARSPFVPLCRHRARC